MTQSMEQAEVAAMRKRPRERNEKIARTGEALSCVEGRRAGGGEDGGESNGSESEAHVDIKLRDALMRQKVTSCGMKVERRESATSERANSVKRGK